jgi:hypothetical protein
MAVNDPFAPPAVRQPRLRVSSGTTPIPGAISATITSNNHYQADNFDAVFALNADPAFNASWWGNETSVPITISVGMLQGDGGTAWTQLFVGQIDQVSIDFAAGIVNISGRDLTSKLIEAKTQEAFVNQTSSEVAKTLAGRVGLTADVTKTTTLVGDFYRADSILTTHGTLSRSITYWDVLVFLARREGFDVWVDGTTLRFHPVTNPSADPWRVVFTPASTLGFSSGPPSSNVAQLVGSRALTLAKDIQVTVMSYNSRTQHAVKKIVKSSQANSRRGGDPPQDYLFVRPNLSEDQALAFAQARLAELSQHERVVEFDTYGDTILTARNMIRVEGTASSWDQVYYPDEIRRTLTFEGGFGMSVRAKNQSPVTATVVQ